jgi:hypothetical protein
VTRPRCRAREGGSCGGQPRQQVGVVDQYAEQGAGGCCDNELLDGVPAVLAACFGDDLGVGVGLDPGEAEAAVDDFVEQVVTLPVDGVVRVEADDEGVVVAVGGPLGVRRDVGVGTRGLRSPSVSVSTHTVRR